MTPKSPSALVAIFLAGAALGALAAAIVVFLWVASPPPSPTDYFSIVTAIATTSIAWQLSRPEGGAL